MNRNNGELLGIYGNLVNRTLVFVEKYFDNKIPEGELDSHIEVEIELLKDYWRFSNSPFLN